MSCFTAATQTTTDGKAQGFSLDNMVIKADDSLWRWGDNYYGEVGDGTTENRPTPVKIMDDVAWAQGTLAIKKDGSLWSWGDFSGDGTSEARLSPLKIMNNVKSAFTQGNSYKLALKNDGTLWAWDRRLAPRSVGVGDGSAERCLAPVMILENVESICAGSQNAYAVKEDGSLWGWGKNKSFPYTEQSVSLLGDGTTEDRLSPVKIMDDVTAVKTSYETTMAIKKDGSLWVWGDNEYGHLGLETMGPGMKRVMRPTKLLDGVKSVNYGVGTSFAIKIDDSLWAWGNNAYGQLGDGTTEFGYTPKKIMEGVASVAVSDGSGAHVMAIKTDGALWGWGENVHSPTGSGGGLGDGTKQNRYSPVKIMENVAAVDAGSGYQTRAVKTDGTLWVWGSNLHDDLGDGSGEDQLRPVKIMDGVRLPGGAAVSPPNAPVYATASQEAAVEYLVHADIYKGDENGDLNLEEGLTRAELAVILARLTITKSPNLDEERIKNSFGAPFDDVPGWAIGYVTFCWQLDLVKGVSATKFDPQGMVNSKMVCTVILRWLGYAETDWSYDTAVSKAQAIGLTEDANVSGAIIKRGDTAVIIYRALDGHYTKTPSPTTPVPTPEPVSTPEPTHTPTPTPTHTPTPIPTPIIKDVGLDVASVKIGDSVSIAEKALGSPYRTVTGDLQYRFYGGYSSFAMLGIRGETVEYAYANYSIPAAGGGHRLYKDDRGGGRIYAVAAGKAGQETSTVTEAIIFEAANAFRAFHDLSALTWNDKLGAAARAHSEDMAALGYFSHFTPEGKSPADRMTAAGYRWLDWGENITVSYITGVEAVDNWVHSTSGHREQILTKSHTETGVGCADVSKSEWGTYATQKFGYPSV
ncbi:MAG: CAP domain-containing protein [Oscillospiraceae bacterium]|nr:CAP domain-containing protein [Oscillospiraceae bacterium]